MQNKFQRIITAVWQQPRFLAMFAIIWLIGIIISVGLVGFYQVRIAGMEETAQTKVALRAKEVADKIENYLISTRQLAKSTAHLIAPLRNDKTIVEQTLKGMLLSAPQQTIYGIGAWFEPYQFDKKTRYFGPYIHQGDVGKPPVLTYEWTTEKYDFHRHNWYQAGKKANGKIAFTEPYFDTDLVYMSASLAFFTDKQDFNGVITVDMVLPLLHQLVLQEHVDQREVIYVTTARNAIFVHPQQKELLQFAAKQGKTIKTILELQHTVLDQFRGVLDLHKYFVAQNPVRYTNWTIHVETQKSYMLSAANDLFNAIAVILVVLWIVVLTSSSGLLRFSVLSFIAKQKEVRLEAERREHAEAAEKLRKAEQEQQILEQKVADRTQELSQALEKIKTSQTQLVQSEKMAMLGQMVAGLAHEINTPLGYMKNNLIMTKSILEQFDQLVLASSKLEQVFKQESATAEEQRDVLDNLSCMTAEIIEQELPDATSQLLEDILYGVTQVSELVLSLRTFTQLDQAIVQEVDIHDCIDSALRIGHHRLKHVVEVHKNYGDLPTIECSPARINQVILNLLHNAIDAISAVQKHGEIFITTTNDTDTIQIKIEDNGKGIDTKHLDRIFEPFYTTKPAGEGAGLGLAICSQIIEQHKGKIQIESTAGQGTMVIITLPA